jgi:hypothetical protein
MLPTYTGPSFEEDQLYEADKRLAVQFYYDAVQNEFKSNQEGRPIFDQVAMIRIFTPGSRDVFVTKVTQHYRDRFPQQWQKFETSNEEAVDGTPLDQVTFLTVNQIAELKSVNCHTIEQLAGMSDTQAGKMMGMNGLRVRAKTFLENARNEAPLLRLQAELDKRDIQIEDLRRQIAEIVALQATKDASK